MSTEYQLTVIPMERVTAMDQVASGYSSALAQNTTAFTRAFITAQAMNQLRELMTPEVMKPLMALMNSDLGFLTDRDPKRPRWNKQKGCFEETKPYPEEVVKDCLITGILQGLSVVGNQINIISGRCYVPKNGTSAMLKRLPGLQNLVISYGVPKLMTGGALVPVAASWIYNGTRQKLAGLEGKDTIEIPVKVNEQMGADAILGKAERKAKARIYAQITGSEVADGDIDDALAGAKIVGSATEGSAAGGSIFDAIGQGGSLHVGDNLKNLGTLAQPVQSEPLPQNEKPETSNSAPEDEIPMGTPAQAPAPASQATVEVKAEPATPPAAEPPPVAHALADEVCARIQREGLSGAKFMNFARRQNFATAEAQSPRDIPEANLRKILNAWTSVAGICGNDNAGAAGAKKG
jgi:hypothetical protein